MPFKNKMQLFHIAHSFPGDERKTNHYGIARIIEDIETGSLLPVLVDGSKEKSRSSQNMQKTLTKLGIL